MHGVSMRRMLEGVLLVVAGLAVFNGVLYLRQPAMVFFPESRLDQSPADWGLAHEDVWIETGDGVRLHGWFLPHPRARRVVLFFHGNAGNISHRRETLEILHRLGLNILIFDYRGYGRSGGRPGEQGLYRDARAAWRWLREQRGFAAGQIVLFGRSLGGVVATRLAAEVTPGALIVESAFTSARDMARAIFPVLSHVMVLRYRFDAVSAMRRVRCPVLVLHSPDDEIVPFALGEALYRAANPPKRFFRMQGGHNDGFLRSQPAYGQALVAFLAGPVTSTGAARPSGNGA